MVEIGDIGKRILKEYGINVYSFCPVEFYNKTYDKVDDIMRERKKPLNDIPKALRLEDY